MVDWDSKERGYAITGDEGTDGIYLCCSACKRTVIMLWPDVLKTWGVGAYTRDIARSLKCSQCGARRGYILAYADSRPVHCRDHLERQPHDFIGAIQWQRKLL